MYLDTKSIPVIYNNKKNKASCSSVFYYPYFISKLHSLPPPSEENASPHSLSYSLARPRPKRSSLTQVGDAGGSAWPAAARAETVSRTSASAFSCEGCFPCSFRAARRRRRLRGRLGAGPSRATRPVATAMALSGAASARGNKSSEPGQ
jgi:hypothetical protein